MHDRQDVCSSRRSTFKKSVAHRVVTLTGEVRSAAEEEAALPIAHNTEAVANVVDQLNVVPPEGEATTGVDTPREPTLAEPLAGDVGITAEVKSKLLADPDVAGLKIDVDTSARVVTLTGTVNTEAEKIEALQIARQVAGVSSVTDRLTIDRRP
jgi:hyperosmotically inducible periplasmic protein